MKPFESREAAPKPEYKLPHTPEAAWLVGITASCGYSNPESKNDKRAAFMDQSEEVANMIAQNAHTVFPHNNIDIKPYNRQTTKSIFLYGKNIVGSLGDLRGNSWNKTLNQKHTWLLKKEDFILKFVEGFFEGNGSIGTKGTIIFSIQQKETAILFSYLLKEIGVKAPYIKPNHTKPEGIDGVGILNQADFELFVSKVHIENSEKAVKIKSIIDRIATERASFRTSILHDWIGISDRLGASPRLDKIVQLKKSGECKYSATVFKNRIGEGSFTKAREHLDEIYHIVSVVRSRFPHHEISDDELSALDVCLQNSDPKIIRRYISNWEKKLQQERNRTERKIGKQDKQDEQEIALRDLQGTIDLFGERLLRIGDLSDRAQEYLDHYGITVRSDEFDPDRLLGIMNFYRDTIDKIHSGKPLTPGERTAALRTLNILLQIRFSGIDLNRVLPKAS